VFYHNETTLKKIFQHYFQHCSKKISINPMLSHRPAKTNLNWLKKHSVLLLTRMSLDHCWFYHILYFKITSQGYIFINHSNKFVWIFIQRLLYPWISNLEKSRRKICLCISVRFLLFLRCRHKNPLPPYTPHNLLPKNLIKKKTFNPILDLSTHFFWILRDYFRSNLLYIHIIYIRCSVRPKWEHQNFIPNYTTPCK
jgi:hypothetical protein